MRSALMNIALEGLIGFRRDGRPQSWLAEEWSSSPDGLRWRIRLRPNVQFHDGTPVTAAAIREILIAALPNYIGPAYLDVERIEAASEDELELVLRRRSTFVLEGLDVLLQKPGSAGVGTGPFYPVPSSTDDLEMRANEQYYLGTPLLDRIVLRPYETIRSAWADLLREQVDMLYEVGADAIESLDTSSDTMVYSFLRRYAFVVILNVRRPVLQESGLRRALNAAVDRDALIAGALNGHGAPAASPVWPYHWAYNPDLPGFGYHPQEIAPPERPIRFTCLYSEPSYERLGLALQRQLREIGVEVTLEQLPLDAALARVEAGDFDAFLADAGTGPTLLKSFVFWYSGSPINWGGYSSPHVDHALDRIRGAVDDQDYRDGVAAFQQAIVADPPAIFLAWSERARAVSTRFEVPVEPDRDILSTLRLWRPAGAAEHVPSP
jgi:peptide/nickel transport system substrate-binding protein